MALIKMKRRNPRRGPVMESDAILNALKRSVGAYISGEELCKDAGISRSAIWKRVEKLREDGYSIHALPNLGYRLTGIPDSLIPEEIRSGLKAKILGKEIISYEKVDSTNIIAYQLSEKGAREGTVIISDEQLKGKGRQGRIWQSPPKSGIYMSVILRPEISPNEISRITLTAAVAVAKTIRSFTALDVRIKWPNDILINNKKVCGILTEMKAEQDRIDFLVLGIGVNVNTEKKDLPEVGTSLRQELLRSGNHNNLSRIALTQQLLESIEKYYILLKKGNFKSIIDEWKALSSIFGSRIKVSLSNKTIEATAHDLDSDGFLIIKLDSGQMRKISSGDITVIR